MTIAERFKLGASLTGVTLGMLGCFLLPVGLLAENGPAAFAGSVLFIIGLVSAFID